MAQTDISSRSSEDAPVTEQAKEKAGEVADQARQTVSDVRSQGREYVRSTVNDRSSQAGQRVHSLAQDLRSFGSELRNQGKDGPAQVVERIAEQGEHVAGYLRTTDGDRMLRDVEQFARRNPWAVLAGGVAMGFVAARFLRASSQQRSQSPSLSTPHVAQAPISAQPTYSAEPTDLVEQRSADQIRTSTEPGYSTTTPDQDVSYPTPRGGNEGSR